MRRIKLILFVIMISVFIAGCSGGSSNDNLSKEDVIEKASNSYKNIKSISQETEIVLQFDMVDNKDKQRITLDSEVIYDSKHNPETVWTKSKSVFGEEEVSFDFYKDPSNMYINEGDGWIEYNSNEDYGTTYKPILNTFLESANEFEMEEKDSSYKFTFKGKDGNIYRSVGTPYNLNYSGIPDDEIELDIYFIIEKKDMFLKDMEIQTRGFIDADNSVSINGSTEFDNFNELKEIEKPVVN